MKKKDQKKDTLFILGSGVSVDHKYPTGKKLLEDIINVLDEKISFSKLDEKNENNQTVSEISSALNMSRATIYRYIDQRKQRVIG